MPPLALQYPMQQKNVTRPFSGFTPFACMLTIWKGCSVIKGGMQSNAGAINDNLTFFSEIYGDPPANVALDLSGSPFWVLRMADQHARGKNGV